MSATSSPIYFAGAAIAAFGLASYAVLRSSSVASVGCPIPESLRKTLANPHHKQMAEEKQTPPTVVVITGAAGQIAYSLIFGVASGRLLGPNRPVELRLLDIPPALKVLEGVAMELDDCAYPLVTKAVITTDYKEAFEGADIALLVGARPRGPGMDRKDLLQANASIFKGQGQSLNTVAKKNVKILVVGNPANTNALITQHEAQSLEQVNFTAMTRLDQNRAKSQLAKRLNVSVTQIKNVIIWGNHSNTQYPDVNHAYVIDYPNKGDKTPIRAAIKDDDWLNGDFIKTVQLRGGAIIEKLGKSSAASAANAAIDHVRDWISGSDEYVSMAVPSTGAYGIPPGVIFSFPCVTCNGTYKIVEGLSIDDFSRQKIQTSYEELLQEKKDAGL